MTLGLQNQIEIGICGEKRQFQAEGTAVIITEIEETEFRKD